MGKRLQNCGERHVGYYDLENRPIEGIKGG